MPQPAQETQSHTGVKDGQHTRHSMRRETACTPSSKPREPHRHQRERGEPPPDRAPRGATQARQDRQHGEPRTTGFPQVLGKVNASDRGGSEAVRAEARDLLAGRKAPRADSSTGYGSARTHAANQWILLYVNHM